VRAPETTWPDVVGIEIGQCDLEWPYDNSCYSVHNYIQATLSANGSADVLLVRGKESYYDMSFSSANTGVIVRVAQGTVFEAATIPIKSSTIIAKNTTLYGAGTILDLSESGLDVGDGLGNEYDVSGNGGVPIKYPGSYGMGNDDNPDNLYNLDVGNYLYYRGELQTTGMMGDEPSQFPSS